MLELGRLGLSCFGMDLGLDWNEDGMWLYRMGLDRMG